MNINIQKLKIDKTYEIILRDLLKRTLSMFTPKKTKLMFDNFKNFQKE